MVLFSIRIAATRLARLLCLALPFSLVSSCSDGSIPTGGCAAPRSISVLITVRDSISGNAAAEGATGTLVGAGVSDALIQDDSLTLEGGDRLGTFTVTIERAGYRTWSAIDVPVREKGPCGNVLPVQLTARLQPTPP